ncbi:MAG: hypothetical protein KF777_15830 [Planctomycetaceae bacterium]|nr:hypothetical protein [Planctomycetaceae bacterium]
MLAVTGGLATGGAPEFLAGSMLGVGAVVYAVFALLGAFICYLNAYLCHAASECILSWAAKKFEEGFAPIRP